jgi:phosphoglycolate phosphatase
MPPKVVIFDWDGTLMDSVGHIVDSLMYAANLYELPLTRHQAANVIGLGLPEAMAALFPHHPHLCAEIQAEYSRHYVANSSQTQLFAGIPELLDDLDAKGVLLAVATGKSRAGLDRVLAQSGTTDRFAITRCAGETQSKPHPQMLQDIVEYLGLPPNQCVMVGDTTYDLEMAANMGMPSIGVSYGVHPAAQLQQYHPRAVVDDVWALRALLLEA